MPAASQTLHRRAGIWGRFWLAALGIALSLQVAGLVLPFQRIAVFADRWDEKAGLHARSR